MSTQDDQDRGRSDLRTWLADHVGKVIVGVLTTVISAIVLVQVGVAFGNDGTTSTTATGERQESTTTSAEPLLAECRPPLDPDVEWVQVESYPAEPDRWLVAGAVEDGLVEFCDGSELLASDSSVMMVADPLTADDVAAFDGSAPPPQLAKLCELRRRLRVAGGARPYRALGMSSYFSDFLLIPSRAFIGPNRCHPFLSTDPEFGSRAAMDRYFGVLAMVGDGTIGRETAAELLDEVTTEAFRERSGGVDAILDAWAACTAVDVLWMSTPVVVRGFDSINTHVQCREADGSNRTREFELAFTEVDQTPSRWQMHWDLRSWGAAPPA